MNAGYLRAKRVLDIAFTLLILLPLCLLIAIVAVLVRWDSPGPIFFRQKRVGLAGAEFPLLKIRSMYVESDESLHRDSIVKYMNGQQLQGGTAAAVKFQFKLSDDPRVTRVGRIIRKYSIDELPQFFNVLRGQMTLVGPRPPLPYEVELYGSREWVRLCGKPGLTGIWQVYGRSCVTFQDMVEMDIEYQRHQSLWEDLKLIVLTVPVMIHGRGGV
jgi:lipopolysaccharide/colanic/teichoic acid biosynthesis glycosyltransferase